MNKNINKLTKLFLVTALVLSYAGSANAWGWGSIKTATKWATEKTWKSDLGKKAVFIGTGSVAFSVIGLFSNRKSSLQGGLLKAAVWSAVGGTAGYLVGRCFVDSARLKRMEKTLNDVQKRQEEEADKSEIDRLFNQAVLIAQDAKRKLERKEDKDERQIILNGLVALSNNKKVESKIFTVNNTPEGTFAYEGSEWTKTDGKFMSNEEVREKIKKDYLDSKNEQES